MLKHVALILASILFSVSTYSQKQAQDTIFFMNGNIVGERVIDTAFTTVTIFNPKKPLQRINFESDQLYMVKFRNGYKRFYYYQDSTINNWFTRDEMWMFMKGEIDARKGFTARGALITGGVFGLLGGMTGTFWGPVAPYGFMALSGVTKIRIKHHTVSNPSYIESDAYILGYERIARQKRKTKALIGGTIGLALGYAVYAIFHQSYPETINFGFIN